MGLAVRIGPRTARPCLVYPKAGPVYPVVVPSEVLFRTLAGIDRDHADRVQATGCWCGGRLHKAVWMRKPRGAELPDDLLIRWGLCCGACRRRTLPCSVLFAGRRLYLKAVLLLVVAARQRDRAEASMAFLRRTFGVDAKTVARWMKRFLDALPQSPDWLKRRGQIAANIRDADIPAALFDAFGDPVEALLSACRIVPDL